MMKKSCWMAAVAALVMASTVSLWRQRLQLAASDLRCRQLESALFAATNKVAAISKGKAAAVASPGAAAAATNAVPQCLGYEVTDDDDSGVRLRLYFSKEPDLAAIGLYVKFSPGVEGLSIGSGISPTWRGRYAGRHYVEFGGDGFAYRTNYTLTVSSGLPFAGGDSLDRDSVFAFRRRDRRQSVDFHDVGRYLPAVGRRALLVDCVNVTGICCSVAAVLPENIVQLLAREEGKYARSMRWMRHCPGDSIATEELALAPHCWAQGAAPADNLTHTLPVELRTSAGAASNGVYHVTVRNAVFSKREVDDDGDIRDTDGQWYRVASRLVCITDLALNAREAEGEVRVWVTSLSHGRPMAGAKVTIYAKNRELLASALTDARGEAICRLPPRDGGRNPFALVAEAEGDLAFMALERSMAREETLPCGTRPGYLADEAIDAFLWSERGIYRHGEAILAHAIVRNRLGVAPRPLPLVFSLVDPEGRVAASATCLTDAYGAAAVTNFTAGETRPSGRWTLRVALPGEKAKHLAERPVKIEEFVPPCVRVTVRGLADGGAATGIVFKVAAEHLFGGPARGLAAGAGVTFRDEPFAPAGWEGYRFGDCRLGLNPNFTRLNGKTTDANGEALFSVDLPEDAGKPKAALRLTVQAFASEPGGRSAYSRANAVVHAHRFYLGVDLPETVRAGADPISCRVAAVDREGRALAGERALSMRLVRIDCTYSLRRSNGGAWRWESERVRMDLTAAAKTVRLDATGRGEVRLPPLATGDYELCLEDEASGVTSASPFWVSAGDDAALHASLTNPERVTLAFDRPFYREGERPRLTVKSPFPGEAYLAVLREGVVSSRVLALTNATSVVELDPVTADLAPNADVAVSVVRAVPSNGDCRAARAHALAPLAVRPRRAELPVAVTAKVTHAESGGARLRAFVTAAQPLATGDVAVVTVVDEGINLLTGERVPAPVDHFARSRQGWHPGYDTYGRLLPLVADDVRVGGVETGGDDGSDLMNRVSPVPSRRFRPLAQWRLAVPLTNGTGEVEFDLGEFVGEVRVTAVAYSRAAVGAAAVKAKVSPRLVMEPDAPRFAAPGDRFALTLTLANRSGTTGEVAYAVTAEGALSLSQPFAGSVRLADGEVTTCSIPVGAIAVGEGRVRFRATGLGETHVETIVLPVRPACGWQGRSETVALRPGERHVSTNGAAAEFAAMTLRRFTMSPSPLAELESALEYLSAYPYGCLEQTVSRAFPLLASGGILNRLPGAGDGAAETVAERLGAGVSRVSSMVRAHGFVMWPDTDCLPWERDVEPYAAHFLVAASAAGCAVEPEILERVKGFCRTWAISAETNRAAYACQVLAFAGCPDRDRMFTLYEARGALSPVARARLAHAFARLGDRRRSRELLGEGVAVPADAVEASNLMLALIETDPEDTHLPFLAQWLVARRDASRGHWLTTSANAHALLALAAYHRVRLGAAKGNGAPELVLVGSEGERTLSEGEAVRVTGDGALTVTNCGTGEGYLNVSELSLVAPESVTNVARLVRVSRRYLTADGAEADLGHVLRGEVLIVELTLAAERVCELTDLVVEDLLPAGFEPEPESVVAAFDRGPGRDDGRSDWVLRSDARDDRVIVFSRPVRFECPVEPRRELKFRYAVRAVTAGDFILPGTVVEAMYAPEIRAVLVPGRVKIE